MTQHTVTLKLTSKKIAARVKTRGLQSIKLGNRKGQYEVGDLLILESKDGCSYFAEVYDTDELWAYVELS